MLKSRRDEALGQTICPLEVRYLKIIEEKFTFKHHVKLKPALSIMLN